MPTLPTTQNQPDPAYAPLHASAVLLGACALIATAYALGASWLTTPLLGLPTGIWAIVVVFAVLRWGQFRPRGVSQGLTPGDSWLPVRAKSATERQPRPGPFAHLTWAVGGVLGSLITWGIHRAYAFAWLSKADAERALGAVGDWADRLPMPARPFQLALAVPPDLRDGVDRVARACGLPVETIGLDTIGHDPADACLRHGLDAVLHQNDDGTHQIVVMEREGREAAWHDWAGQRPIGFASAFPLRIDPAMVTLGRIDADDDAQVRLAATLMLTAAALGRSAPRLTLTDRLAGRRPIVGTPVNRNSAGGQDPMEYLLDELDEAYRDVPSGTPANPATLAAARIVQAWMATWDGHADVERRYEAIANAAARLADEPESLLRLATARIAMFEDEQGLDTLTEADRALRHGDRPLLHVDHAAFLQSELEHAVYGPFTLGRVAAGLCLCCARTDDDRLPYLREDLMDDIRYSGWLIGRDQDSALLVDLFRRLESARADEHPGHGPTQTETDRRAA